MSTLRGTLHALLEHYFEWVLPAPLVAFYPMFLTLHVRIWQPFVRRVGYCLLVSYRVPSRLLANLQLIVIDLQTCVSPLGQARAILSA